MKSIVYWPMLFCLLLLSCKNIGSPHVKFEKSFEEILQTATISDKSFCIILSNPECPPCESLHDFLYRDINKTIGDKVIFNIVDISLPQNKWYQQLIVSKAIPTTLCFSPQGDLKAIIQGASKAATECIKESIDGRTDCSHYLYKASVTANTKNENIIKAFNLLLKAQAKLQKREDASAELKESLGMVYYPYGIWLQMQNERNKGNEEGAVYWAKQMLIFQNHMYAVLYPDLYLEARYIINPQFNPDNMPLLKIEKDSIDLGECKVGEGIDFKVKLKNAGKDNLLIHDVTVSCSCLKLQSKNNYAIEAGGEDYLSLTFTANAQGGIEREIILTTNEIEPLKIIKVMANARE